MFSFNRSSKLSLIFIKTVKVPKLEMGAGCREGLDQFPSLTVFFYLKASLSQYSTTCREAVKFWPDKL